MRRNIISIICSAIAWSVIMLLTGMFGSFAFAIGLIALKVIGSLLLLAFFIRIPIVLMEREDSKNLIKIKNKINEGVQASLIQVADSVKRSSINIVGRDNPLMPPDYDE